VREAGAHALDDALFGQRSASPETHRARPVRSSWTRSCGIQEVRDEAFPVTCRTRVDAIDLEHIDADAEDSCAPAAHQRFHVAHALGRPSKQGAGPNDSNGPMLSSTISPMAAIGSTLW